MNLSPQSTQTMPLLHHVATSPLIGSGGGGQQHHQSKLKSSTLKMMNHTRLRAQCSPYSLDHHHHHNHHANQTRVTNLPTPNIAWQQARIDLSTSETEGESSSSMSNQNNAHPTTPVSSSLNESSGGGVIESPSQQSSVSSSLPITALLKKQDLNRGGYSTSKSISSTTTTSNNEPGMAHLTTPVTESDNSSPTSVSSRSGAFGGCLSTAGASVEALSRSASLGSLCTTADDVQSIKSSYTSAASSCINGIMTPAYSELPDSPGGSPTHPQQQQLHNQHQYANIINYPMMAAHFDPQFAPSLLACNG